MAYNVDLVEYLCDGYFIVSLHCNSHNTADHSTIRCSCWGWLQQTEDRPIHLSRSEHHSHRHQNTAATRLHARQCCESLVHRSRRTDMQRNKELQFQRRNTMSMDVRNPCIQCCVNTIINGLFTFIPQKWLSLRYGAASINFLGNVRNWQILSRLSGHRSAQILHIRIHVLGSTRWHHFDCDTNGWPGRWLCLHYTVLRAWHFCDTQR